ncbi:MAG: SDR family oxidoreductase [Gloeobacteraceae cyanobacterium ES-bin-316]|nr:SDR family oxidoreductase [Ferruginibacter sp.]
MSFKNKIVIITGAAGGIGRALTTRFLKEGAKVCAVDMSTEVLDKLVADFKESQDLFTVVADISSEESTKQLQDKVKEKWGAADVVINNAGWFPFTEFEDISFEEWQKVISINLTGNFLMTKALLPLLKQSAAGRIINISSGSIFNPPPNQTHYVSAKAGVIGFTRALAVSLGKFNITVNAITPGLTATPSLVKSVPAEMIDKLAASGAIKRRQTAEDLVGAIIFLASDDAAFVTGQTINVDGGRSFI